MTDFESSSLSSLSEETFNDSCCRNDPVGKTGPTEGPQILGGTKK